MYRLLIVPYFTPDDGSYSLSIETDNGYFTNQFSVVNGSFISCINIPNKIINVSGLPNGCSYIVLDFNYTLSLSGLLKNQLTKDCIFVFPRLFSEIPNASYFVNYNYSYNSENFSNQISFISDGGAVFNGFYFLDDGEIGLDCYLDSPYFECFIFDFSTLTIKKASFPIVPTVSDTNSSCQITQDFIIKVNNFIDTFSFNQVYSKLYILEDKLNNIYDLSSHISNNVLSGIVYDLNHSVLQSINDNYLSLDTLIKSQSSNQSNQTVQVDLTQVLEKIAVASSEVQFLLNNKSIEVDLNPVINAIATNTIDIKNTVNTKLSTLVLDLKTALPSIIPTVSLNGNGSKFKDYDFVVVVGFDGVYIVQCSFNLSISQDQSTIVFLLKHKDNNSYLIVPSPLVFKYSEVVV
jgi:hypothetical protein